MKDSENSTAHDFWKRLDDVTAGMLKTGPEDFAPMAPHGDEEEKAIWFITAKGTAAHQAAIEGMSTHFAICDQSAKLHAVVKGKLQEVSDPKKVDELWSRVTGAWFEGGRDDPDVRLIRLTPSQAEVWLTDGGASFFYEIARANIQEEHTPDVGTHEVVNF